MSVQGLVKLAKAFEKLSKEAEKETKRKLVVASSQIEANAKRSIQKKSAGKEQIRYGGKGKMGTSSKRKVIASKPFDPPNTDTGFLINSIKTELDISRAEALVGTNLKYGKFLEFGTRNMQPRPWLGPAFYKYLKDARAGRFKFRKLKGK